MDAFRISQNEAGVSKHLHITHLNDPTIFEADNGQIGCTVKIQGVPFDTATNEELNNYKRTWHHALCTMGEEFCIYANTIRRKMDIALDGEFKEQFARAVDRKYHKQFKNTDLYSNEIYITILYKGLDSGKFGKLLKLYQMLSNKAVKDARADYREKAVTALKKVVAQFMTSMGRFRPHLLGSKDKELGYSELLSFLALFVNGIEPIKFKNPNFASPISNGVSKGVKALELYPEGNVANYLPAKRIFFGDYIEFQGANRESLFAVMLSIKEYGTDSAPIMLDKLLHLDCEFIHTNSFAIEPSDIVQSKITKQVIRMENANDKAFSQIDELRQCSDDLASGRLKLGYHHNTLMLISRDLEHLKDSVNKAVKVYHDVLFVATQESIGMEPAFWAQIPSNQKYIVRSVLITSKNFVDFAPLHNYRTGYRDLNHLGSAVTLIETPSKTPMFFNYHTRGSGNINDLTPGHTTIIGGNGSGKTVFMGFMDSQMSRYGGRSFFFDRDRGLEIYIRAMKGVYAIISPDYPSDTKFNPFWLDDTHKNRLFLKQWLAELIKEADETELPAEIDAQITGCVDYAYDSLSKEHRNLTTATQLLPVDFPRWSRLKKWLRSDGKRNAGEYAYLFDHDEDHLDLNISKVGFDFTELMGQSKNVLTAVCMYLVHRIQESLDGQRVSIYFDEGWQILDNEYWKKQLKKDLPTLRKNNAHIILATQSPESVVSSALSAQFLDNCATNIFFCNSKANYEKHYKHFNVSVSEFDFIKNTPSELRLFLYKQSAESAICKLNLANMDDELAIYSANKSTIRLLEQIREEVGDNPKDWTPLFHERRKHIREEH